jgi:hypothetical protein
MSLTAAAPLIGAYCPVGSARLSAAVAFATGLVLKLGGSRLRWTTRGPHEQPGRADGVLRFASLIGWVLLALIGGVVVNSFPGLTFLRSG